MARSEVMQIQPAPAAAILVDQTLRTTGRSLAAVTVPALLCIGRVEAVVTIAAAELMRDRMPNGPGDLRDFEPLPVPRGSCAVQRRRSRLRRLAFLISLIFDARCACNESRTGDPPSTYCHPRSAWTTNEMKSRVSRAGCRSARISDDWSRECREGARKPSHRCRGLTPWLRAFSRWCFRALGSGRPRGPRRARRRR